MKLIIFDDQNIFLYTIIFFFLQTNQTKFYIINRKICNTKHGLLLNFVTVENKITLLYNYIFTRRHFSASMSFNRSNNINK